MVKRGAVSVAGVRKSRYGRPDASVPKSMARRRRCGHLRDFRCAKCKVEGGVEMAWSTRELADMAGTTVSAIRHYHRLGLLPLPERRFNGYKEYGVEHLVSVLRIRRYADLGVPLAEIDLSGADEESTAQMLRTLDGELEAGIERMARARSDIAEILDGRASISVPSGFKKVSAQLSNADRAMAFVFSQLFDGQQLTDLQGLVAGEIDEAGVEFDMLPSDAGEDVRVRLAERLAPGIEEHLRAHAWLSEPVAHVSRRVRRPATALSDALAELYSPAQLDVLARAYAIANARVAAASSLDGYPPAST